MGTLNFSKEKEHLAKIRKRLAKRGLAPDLKNDWEIHGPHQDMNYQVYVGWARPNSGEEEDYVCVVIYPHAVYEIEEPADWYKPESENRIYTV